MATSKSTSKKSDKPASREPQTMEELLSLYGDKVRGLSQGDRIKGRVVEKSGRRLILDIGGKSEGIVAEKAFNEAQGYIKSLNIGDMVEATVIVPETPDGYTILSLRDASESAAWGKLEKAEEVNSDVVVVGKSITPSGVMVEVDGLTGFIPNSQLGREVGRNPQALIGKHFKVSVIDVDKLANKIVLSEKAVSEAEDIELAGRAMEEVQEGKEYVGVVTTVYDFGAFVRINVPVGKSNEEVPLEGLVHISEMAWDKVSHPDKTVKAGDKVKVVAIGRRDGKLAFSMKQTQKDPWGQVDTKYKKEEKVKGKVSKLTDFGVFVQLEPGIEGLIHVTKIPPGKRLKEGEEVSVYVEEVNKDARKISLGLVLTAKPVGYR